MQNLFKLGSRCRGIEKWARCAKPEDDKQPSWPIGSRDALWVSISMDIHIHIHIQWIMDGYGYFFRGMDMDMDYPFENRWIWIWIWILKFGGWILNGYFQKSIHINFFNKWEERYEDTQVMKKCSRSGRQPPCICWASQPPLANFQLVYKPHCKFQFIHFDF